MNTQKTIIPANEDEYRALIRYYNEQIAELNKKKSAAVRAYAINNALPIGTIITSFHGWKCKIYDYDVSEIYSRVAFYKCIVRNFDGTYGPHKVDISPEDIVAKELPKEEQK